LEQKLHESKFDMKIMVGSTNPVKCNAVIQAVSESYPHAIIEGVSVESGVSSQPFSDRETRQGARNRARAARDLAYVGNFHPPLEVFHQLQTEYSDNSQRTVLGVGLEGGVMEFEGALWSTVWVAVVDQHDAVWESSGARFQLPEVVADLLRQGDELGSIMDKLLGTTNTKQHGGMVSTVTLGFVDRTEEYAALAKMAIGLWHGRDWTKQLQLS
jgi:non-canonical (house-cleaning) NTP pyrophosphatase